MFYISKISFQTLSIVTDKKKLKILLGSDGFKWHNMVALGDKLSRIGRISGIICFSLYGKKICLLPYYAV